VEPGLVQVLGQLAAGQGQPYLVAGLERPYLVAGILVKRRLAERILEVECLGMVADKLGKRMVGQLEFQSVVELARLARFW